jgi:hypothetical protein
MAMSTDGHSSSPARRGRLRDEVAARQPASSTIVLSAATANIAPRSVIGVRFHHIRCRLGAHDDQLSVVWFHVQIVPFGRLRLFH